MYRKREKVFLELVFCILVAGNSPVLIKRIWEKIGRGFLTLNEKKLSEKLRKLGYRFWRKRAKFIVQARNKIDEVYEAAKCGKREWLVKNVKGIGWKEASHFLRNLGYKNFAILDRHVLRFMKSTGLIEKIPKSLSKKKYLELEEKLRKIAKKLKISLAELDLLIFYLQTKRICER